MIKMILRRVIPGASMVLLFVASALASENFESPANRKVSEVLPANLITGPHHRIRQTVVSYGYLHHFSVDSEFGTFKVTGDGALRKLIREIKAIAVLRQIKGSEAFTEGLKHAAKAPVNFARNLINHPVDTISGLPKGIFSLLENVATSITQKHDPSEDARIKQILQVSSWKRDYAHRLGVDVYSSNKVLQEELNSVGWVAAVAGLTVSAVTLPVDATFVVAMKNTRLLNQIGGILKEEPPARVRIINQERLLAMGVARSIVQRFLDHPSFTPRHDTVIVQCLAALTAARGKDAFLTLVLQARDEVSANFFQQLAETMRGYHQTVSPITDISVINGFVLAEARDGSVLLPFALDHGVWSEKGKQLIRDLIGKYRASGFSGRINMWVSGTISPFAHQQAAALGIDVKENVDELIGFID